MHFGRGCGEYHVCEVADDRAGQHRCLSDTSAGSLAWFCRDAWHLKGYQHLLAAITGHGCSSAQPGRQRRCGRPPGQWPLEQPAQQPWGGPAACADGATDGANCWRCRLFPSHASQVHDVMQAAVRAGRSMLPVNSCNPRDPHQNPFVSGDLRPLELPCVYTLLHPKVTSYHASAMHVCRCWSWLRFLGIGRGQWQGAAPECGGCAAGRGRSGRPTQSLAGQLAAAAAAAGATSDDHSTASLDLPAAAHLCCFLPTVWTSSSLPASLDALSSCPRRRQAKRLQMLQPICWPGSSNRRC